MITVHDTSSDGLWAVIEGKDFPATGIMGRSETRDSAHEALASNSWDPGRVVPPGGKSLHKFVKVRMDDLVRHGLIAPPGSKAISLRPGDFANVGKTNTRYIPEYPHTCPACGGKMLNLFTSQEHEGKMPCPGSKKGPERTRKVRV